MIAVQCRRHSSSARKSHKRTDPHCQLGELFGTNKHNRNEFEPGQTVVSQAIRILRACMRSVHVGGVKGATPPSVWRRSRPLLLAGTSATTASDLAVFLNGVLSLFVGEALG